MMPYIRMGMHTMTTATHSPSRTPMPRIAIDSA